MPPDQPTDEGQQQQQPQDGQTPFQPAAPSPDPTSPGSLPDDHPATDTGVQPEEAYGEGTASAAGVSDPSAVADPAPPADTPSGDTPPPSDGSTTPSDPEETPPAGQAV